MKLVSIVRTIALLATIATAGTFSPAARAQTAAEPMKMEKPAASPKVTKAVAVLQPTEGNTVKGVVTFTKVEGGIEVVADVENLTPGVHGFHIHEYGDLSAPDGSSAGGHFNPNREPHAAPDASHRHDGDMGNITADADGKAHLKIVLHHVSFEGKDSILGRGVIVHASPDDLKSQPAGAAGKRVAGGIIGAAKAG